MPKRKKEVTEPEAASSAKPPVAKKRRAAKQKKPPKEKKEKRMKNFVEEPSEDFIQKLERCSMERMFVVGHETDDMEGDSPKISFDFIGSTGNLYQTIIRKVPSCNCPDNRFRRGQCKHLIYVLVHILKAPEHLQYQLAFLTSEIREMWKGSNLSQIQPKPTEDNEGQRKPIEGDCPICFMEFKDGDNVIWCRSSCGNNVHKTCFDKWAATTKHNGIRCVYCRATWQPESTPSAATMLRDLPKGSDGYVNLFMQYGMLPTLPKLGRSTSARRSTSQE